MNFHSPIGILAALVSCFLIIIPNAEARSSGGRSGGGSFKRNSPSRSNPNNSQGGSTTNQTTPYRSTPRPLNTYNRDSNTNYNNNTYNNNSSYTNSNDSSGTFSAIQLLILVAVVGGGGTFAVLIYLLSARFTSNSQQGGTLSENLPREARNETVTATKLQIAMYATARSVQSELNQLCAEADTESLQGLQQLLQETLLVLRRQEEYWSHAWGNSQALKRDKAEEVFQKLSIDERSKFSSETFSNVKGRQRVSQNFSPDQDVPAYIVVTVLVGTEHDKPLFNNLKDRSGVQAAIDAILIIPQEFLLTVEVLWSPQTDQDSLTEDELIGEYTDLVRLF